MRVPPSRAIIVTHAGAPLRLDTDKPSENQTVFVDSADCGPLITTD